MKEKIVEFPDRRRIEEEASQWIVRFESDEPPTQQDISELKVWMAISPVHRDVLMRYAALWNDMDLLSELVLPLGKTLKPKTGLISSLLAPVMFLVALASSFRNLASTAPGRWATVSAVLALGVLAALSYTLLFDQRNAGSDIYATAIGERTTRTLKDGSTLWLNTNSRVEVDYSGEMRRIVLHRGEAFFKVAKDPQRPFEVYAGTRMVRAVGTAFSVYRENHSVKVTVTEGRVALAVVSPRASTATGMNLGNSATGPQDRSPPQPIAAQDAPEEGVTELLGSLVAGQSIVLAGDDTGTMDNVINHERQELSRRLSWRDGLLVFAGEPLDEVVEEVSRYTALQIKIADLELRSMRIGGQFQIGETEALFDALESGFGLQISRLDDKHVEIRAGK